MNDQIKKELQNRQLQAMLLPAQERLRKYTPDQICLKAAVQFDQEKQEFYFESLGKEIHISYPDFVISPPLDMWHTLTLLQYLDTADGTLLREGTISLTEMPGGMARGAGFNKDIEIMIARHFSDMSSEDFAAVCRSLGAKIIPSKADVCAVFAYAPCFPITINFWEADEEFPASGKALVNMGAEHYLTIEAAGGACSAVIQAIANEQYSHHCN